MVSLASWHRGRAGTGSSTDGPGSEALVISSTPAPPAASGGATVMQGWPVGRRDVPGGGYSNWGPFILGSGWFRTD